MGTPQQDIDAMVAYYTKTRDAFNEMNEMAATFVPEKVQELYTQAQADPSILSDLPDITEEDFAPSELPAGLTTDEQAQWDTEYTAFREGLAERILQGARHIYVQATGFDADRVSAIAYYQEALDIRDAAPLDTRWVVTLALAYHYGMKAGGPDTFAEGTARDKFLAVQALVEANAAKIAVAMKRVVADWPSDAASRKEYVDTFRRLKALAGE